MLWAKYGSEIVLNVLRQVEAHVLIWSQAFWTRFFPASEKMRLLLGQKCIGDVVVLQAEFGFPLLTVPRSVKKELGGGALMDIGLYCVQLACMVFDGEKPQSIVASGFLSETG